LILLKIFIHWFRYSGNYHLPFDDVSKEIGIEFFYLLDVLESLELMSSKKSNIHIGLHVMHKKSSCPQENCIYMYLYVFTRINMYLHVLNISVSIR
jgi:hypothetical protein